MSQRPFAWEKSYPPGVHWDAPLTIGTLTEMFDRSVAAHAERPAIEFRGRVVTYGELGKIAERGACALDSLGHDIGRPVALYLPNTLLHPFAFFAAVKTGAPVVHLSPLDAERELQYKLEDSGARTLITTNFANLLPNAVKMLERGVIDRLVVGDDADWGASSIPLLPIPALPGLIPWKTFLAEAPEGATFPTVAPGDLALLQYTGGTTGKPRAAMLSHGNLTASIDIYDHWMKALYEAGDRRETVIAVLPFFHIYGLTTVLLRHIRNGNFILLRVKFDPDQTLHDVEAARATALPGVPTMWIALANRPDIGQRNLSSLKYLGSGGAPLPVEVGARFRQITGHRLGGGWGMMETSPAGTNVPLYCEAPAGTIGLPLPNVEMGIVALDNPHRELAPGEIGELRVRGPNVTRGYWRRPEETAAAFADGYLLTGDIGTMDEDGFFFIVDRKKDMIISGGFNIYPQMIEQTIYEHQSVEEVLVIGVPDPYRVEATKAYIKLKAGAPGFTLPELCAFLADKVGRHEMPAQLEFRDSLPRTAVGKLSKVELRQEIRAGTADDSNTGVRINA
jgi:long-chain acyl-CoA synthetase